MMSKQKILVIGLVLMVACNICTLGFIIFKANCGSFHKDKDRHDRSKFMAKKLHLNTEQEAVVDNLRKENEEKMSVLKLKKDSLRKANLDLIKAEVYDTAQANVLADEIGNCHTQMAKQMAAHFLAVKAVCTKEQLVYFNEFIGHIEERGFGHKRDQEPSCSKKDCKGL